MGAAVCQPLKHKFAIKIHQEHKLPGSFKRHLKHINSIVVSLKSKKNVTKTYRFLQELRPYKTPRIMILVNDHIIPITDLDSNYAVLD